MAAEASLNQPLINETAKTLLEEISRQARILDSNIIRGNQAADVQRLAEAFALVTEHDNRSSTGRTNFNGYPARQTA